MNPVPKPSDVPPELAAVIVKHLQAAEEQLHLAIYALRDSGQMERLDDWKQALAHGMAALFRGLALPLYRQHPSLAPDWIRSKPALPDEGDPGWFDFLLRRGRVSDAGEGTAQGRLTYGSDPGTHRKPGSHPELSFTATHQSVKVAAPTPGGFAVSFEARSQDQVVYFDGWHEHFESADKALECVALAYSGECRLAITYRGRMPVKWILKYLEEGRWGIDESQSPPRLGA